MHRPDTPRALRSSDAGTDHPDEVRTLASFVAHDFNNVLTAVLGNVELMRERLGHDPGPGEIELSRTCLDAIEEVAHRAAGMTQQLLAFSRCLDVGNDPVDLHEAIREGTTAHAPLAESDVTLVIDLAPGGVPPVSGTATQLAEVVECLVRNAAEAMPEGGTITLSTRTSHLDAPGAPDFPGARAGDHVVLRVADQGTGFAEEIRHQALDPFFTTKTHGKSSGLGLAIVTGVVAGVGGFVRILDGEPGTVIEVSLPVHPGPR